MCADTGCSLHELLEATMERLGFREYTRVDIVLADDAKLRLFDALRSEQLTEIGGHGIVRKNLLDGVKLDFADGCWAMFRASGTEPVVRIYMEATARGELPGLADVMVAEASRLAGVQVTRAAH
jgi:phosphomannomutase